MVSGGHHLIIRDTMLLRAECRLQEKVSSGQNPCTMSNHRIKVSLEGMSNAVGQ